MVAHFHFHTMELCFVTSLISGWLSARLKGKINKHSPSRYLHECKLVANFDLLSCATFVNLEFLDTV